MKKILLIALLVAMTVLFTACVEDVNPEATWTLISINDGSSTLEGETLTKPITLAVTSNGENSFDVSGFSGVNHFNGSVVVEKNVMTVQPLAVTMMMGAPEAQALEDTFLKVFNAGGKLSAKESGEETMLIIKNASNKTELQFKKTLLENTSWNLSMYNIGTAVTTIPENVEGVTIAFSDDGRVFGSTGVNNIMGTYEFSTEGALSLSSIGTTRMAAPNQEMRDFEIRLLELLESVVSFNISGQSLTLRSADDATLLVYSR